MPVKRAIKPAKPVHSMMISIQWRLQFWKQMRSYLQCRFTGIQYRLRLRLSLISCIRFVLQARILPERYCRKACGLIACCEENDMSVFDGVRIPVERSAALMKWHMAGEVLVPGVLNVGDIEKTDGCAMAAALADKI